MMKYGMKEHSISSLLFFIIRTAPDVMDCVGRRGRFVLLMISPSALEKVWWKVKSVGFSLISTEIVIFGRLSHCIFSDVWEQLVSIVVVAVSMKEKIHGKLRFVFKEVSSLKTVEPAIFRQLSSFTVVCSSFFLNSTSECIPKEQIVDEQSFDSSTYDDLKLYQL